MSPLVTVLFASSTAFFYVAASWLVKALGASPYLVFVPVVMITLAAGAFFQNDALRRSRLGVVLAILVAIEVIMTFLMTMPFVGADLSLREVAGIIVVFTGIALVGMEPARDQG